MIATIIGGVIFAVFIAAILFYKKKDDSSPTGKDVGIYMPPPTNVQPKIR